MVRGGLSPSLSKAEVRRYGYIQDNISRDFIDKDTHHEDIGQRGTMKYLRESCYRHIRCSVTNSLVALMRK